MPGTEEAVATVAGIAVLGADAELDIAGVFTGALALCVADDGKNVGFWPL